MNSMLTDQSHDLETTIKRVQALVDDDGSGDVATRHAIDAAVGLLRCAGSLMQSRFPLGSASTDGEGGVRLEWTLGEKDVRLVISAQPGVRDYLYHQHSKIYEIDEPVLP